MSPKDRSKSDAKVVLVCQQRIAGLDALPANPPDISYKGNKITVAQARGIYQRCLDTRKDLDAARAQEKSALAKRKGADAERRAVDKTVLDWAANTYGPDSPQAKAIGYSAPNPTQPKTAVKAQAVAQAQETKKAHGVMGKKQRKAIKAPKVESVTLAAPQELPAPAAAGASTNGKDTPTKS
jgi:hypothetical protein